MLEFHTNRSNAQDATQLVSAISLIQEQTEHNQAISKELEGEVRRFEKV